MLLHHRIPFLPIFCQLRNSIIILAAWDPIYIASGRTHRKHRLLYCCELIHCCRYTFIASLHSNARGADHSKHRFSIVARFRFRGNMFTEPLPSNKLFRLSGIISHYSAFCFCVLSSTPILENNTSNAKLGSEFSFLVSRSACVVPTVLTNYMRSRMAS
jgi:hypothetical protein